MRIPLHLVLTAFIVGFVLTYVQPHDQIANQAASEALNDESETSGNFQNLFDSVAKRDARKSEVYRERLVKDAAKEKSAFNEMKSNLQNTKDMNAIKKNNLHKRKSDIENVIKVKRETDEISTERILEWEREYVDKYGNVWNTSGRWPWPEDNKMEDDIMLDVCKQAHRIGNKRPGEICLTEFVERKLEFLTKEYKPIQIDMIFYLQGGLPKPGEIFYFYLMKGLQPDCLFYLNVTKVTSHYYRIADHVCGIKFPVDSA